tara:strand:+ start:264 stop:767 length:504 start_codon:yes stop_codon:yes gene_type:complete
MKKPYKIIKNFMEPEFFKELKTLIIDKEFSWFYRKNMTPNSKIDLGYFTHSFYNDHKINSNHYYKYIIPILKNLNTSAVIEVRANMAPSVFFKNKKSEWHTDYSFTSKTAILYLNNCDGGTELKIGNKIVSIKADANTMLTFDSNIIHRGTASEKVDVRYILNFNYF